jgi:phage terminase large subunit GpA-like protein
MEMLLKGRWIHKYPGRTDHLSYQLGKASSTIASLSFIAEQKYLAEKAAENGDDSLYESYMNNEKGLPYKKIVIKEIDARKLIDRREDYIDPEKKNVIPNGVLILTAFVDAQAGSQTKPARYEGEVWGWGVGEECWMVDRFKIEGNPEDRNVRDKLKNFLLSLEYVRKDGLKRTIRRIGVDAGWASQSIYELVERGWDKWCATKGSNNIRASLLPRKISLVNNDKSVLINLGTQAAKHTLFLRLQEIDETEINIKPNLTDKETEEKKEFIAKIHHTKLFCDLDYFEQLTAEHAVPIIRQNETHYVFQKKKSGLANEAIDIWCGAYAMMKSLNVNWRKYKASVDAKVGALSNQEETTGEVPAANSVLSRMKPAAPLELTKIKTKNKNVVRRPGVNPITNYG